MISLHFYYCTNENISCSVGNVAQTGTLFCPYFRKRLKLGGKFFSRKIEVSAVWIPTLFFLFLCKIFLIFNWGKVEIQWVSWVTHGIRYFEKNYNFRTVNGANTDPPIFCYKIARVLTRLFLHNNWSSSFEVRMLTS